MAISQLVRLGKVAGIGGISLGVTVLLVRPVLDQLSGTSDTLRGWLLLTVTIGAFIIGVLGLFIWALGYGPGLQVARTEGDDAEAHNTDRSNATRGRQNSRTRGNRSPAINQRGR